MPAKPQDGTQAPDALVDDIEHTREQLAATIDALVDRTNPKNIAQRQLTRRQGTVHRRRRLAADRPDRQGRGSGRRLSSSWSC